MERCGAALGGRGAGTPSSSNELLQDPRACSAGASEAPACGGRAMRSLSSAFSALGLLPLARPIQQSSHASAPPPAAAVLPSGSEGRSRQGAWGARGVRWAAIITAIILVSSLVAVPPLVDGETGRPIMDAGLVFPISYLV